MSQSPSTSVGPISLTPPADWQIASLILVGPADTPSQSPGAAATPFQQNLVVISERVDAGETLDGYIGKQTGKLKDQGLMHRPPGPLEKVAMGGGREGALFEHVVLGPSGEKVRQMQLVSLKGNLLYALIASHLDGLAFEAARATFSGMLRSVKLA